MFGDDPDPTVTKVRFGTASDAHTRGVDALCREVQMAGQQKNSWSRKDNEGNREKRELRTDHEFKKTCGCNADDAMMNATNKIKHTATTKNMEGVCSVGLGALQHSTTTRGSRPEI